MIRAAILAAPWFALAIATWTNGEPVSASTTALLCAIVGVVFLVEAKATRIATRIAYSAGIRRACEEVRLEALERSTPAESVAVIDAAMRAIQLAEKP